MASQSFRGAGHAGAVTVPCLRNDALPVEYEVDVLLNDVLRECVGHSGRDGVARDLEDGSRAARTRRLADG